MHHNLYVHDALTAGDSLSYAFIGFDNDQSCEEAYFKMNNAVIDDRRIKVRGTARCGLSDHVPFVRWTLARACITCGSSFASLAGGATEIASRLPTSTCGRTSPANATRSRCAVFRCCCSVFRCCCSVYTRCAGGGGWGVQQPPGGAWGLWLGAGRRRCRQRGRPASAARQRRAARGATAKEQVAEEAAAAEQVAFAQEAQQGQAPATVAFKGEA